MPTHKTSKKNAAAAHLPVVADLLARLGTHLLGAKETKGTFADYIRLLQFYCDAGGEPEREIHVRWLEEAPKELKTDR